MKKFAFVTLLSICVSAIAVTSGNSQGAGMSSDYITNISDTTPTQHKTWHKSTHTTHKKATKPVKDSTK